MKKIHLANPRKTTNTPFCAARVDMAKSQNFLTTEVQEEVTCKLCLMRLGVIEDTRGNWDNRIR